MPNTTYSQTQLEEFSNAVAEAIRAGDLAAAQAAQAALDTALVTMTGQINDSVSAVFDAVVRHDAAQDLDDDGKTTARQNIGAAGFADIENFFEPIADNAGIPASLAQNFREHLATLP